MIGDAKRTIRTVLKANRSARIFFMVFASILLVAGIAIVLLAIRVNVWLGFIEVVIGPGLVYSIRGVTEADRNNTNILKESSKAMQNALTQIQLRRRLLP